jgi:hypothetical protein
VITDLSLFVGVRREIRATRAKRDTLRGEGGQ